MSTTYHPSDAGDWKPNEGELFFLELTAIERNSAPLSYRWRLFKRQLFELEGVKKEGHGWQIANGYTNGFDDAEQLWTLPYLKWLVDCMNAGKDKINWKLYWHSN